MKSIETKELINAMEELEKERGINKEYLLESLEAALVTAYKRNFDSAENVRVAIDSKTGDIKVYSVKEVVKDVENEMLQISLEEAKRNKINQIRQNQYNSQTKLQNLKEQLIKVEFWTKINIKIFMRILCFLYANMSQNMKKKY